MEQDVQRAETDTRNGYHADHKHNTTETKKSNEEQRHRQRQDTNRRTENTGSKENAQNTKTKTEHYYVLPRTAEKETKGRNSKHESARNRTEGQWKQTGQEKEKRSRIKKVSYSVRHYCKVDSLTAATHGGEDRSVAPPLPTPPLPIKIHTTSPLPEMT